MSSSRLQGAVTALVCCGSPITNEELLILDCDVLAPCALEQVLTRRTRGRQARSSWRGQRPDPEGRFDPRGERRARACQTCWRTRGGVSSGTSSGCRACRSTSGRRRGDQRLDEIVTRPSRRPGDEAQPQTCRRTPRTPAVQRVAEATITRGSTPRRPPAAEGDALPRRGLPPVRAGPEDDPRLRDEFAFPSGGRHHRRPDTRDRYREWLPVVEVDGAVIGLPPGRGRSAPPRRCHKLTGL